MSPPDSQLLHKWREMMKLNVGSRPRKYVLPMMPVGLIGSPVFRGVSRFLSLISYIPPWCQWIHCYGKSSPPRVSGGLLFLLWQVDAHAIPVFADMRPIAFWKLPVCRPSITVLPLCIYSSMFVRKSISNITQLEPHFASCTTTWHEMCKRYYIGSQSEHPLRRYLWKRSVTD